MSRGTIASVVPLALWCHARRTHTLSGAHDRHYVRKQEWFIVTNATSTIFQLFGTIAFYSLSLAELNSSNLRQCIVLVCLHPQEITSPHTNRLVYLCKQRTCSWYARPLSNTSSFSTWPPYHITLLSFPDARFVPEAVI
jgi:hypothetical protein